MTKKKKETQTYTQIEKVKGGYGIPGHTDPFISVTTVLGELAKPMLYGWYYKNCSHISPTAYEILKESQDIGHWLNECTDHYIAEGLQVSPEGLDDKKRKVLDNFYSFTKEHELKDYIVDGKPQTEIAVYDQELKCAGSFDRLLYIDGKLTLVDWKTSGDIWDEYLIQLQVYYWMIVECVGIKELMYDQALISDMLNYPSLWVVRLDKSKDFDYNKDVIKMTPDKRIYKGFTKLVDFINWKRSEFKTLTKEIKKNDE